MNLFLRLERALQRAVERPFTRLAGSRLQPVEVARALGRELLANRRVGVDRVYAPNWFRAELSEQDFREFEPYLVQLQREIGRDLIRQARQRRYDFVGPLTVELVANGDVRSGDILASAEIREADTYRAAGGPAGAPMPRTTVLPVIDAPVMPQSGADGDAPRLLIRDERGVEQRIQMTGPELRFGRSLSNDVVLDSLSVSREHARLLREGDLIVEDLASRNGTFVNGQRVQRARVQVGDRIRFGTTEVRVES